MSDRTGRNSGERAIDKSYETDANLHRKSVVPIVQNVADVPVVEDVPEVMILPELWRKTSGVVPDCPHHVVQRGVRCMDVFFSTDDRREYLDLVISIGFKTRVGFPSMVSDE
jgi:hypothetical protein